MDFELGAGRDVNVTLKATTTSVAHASLLVAAAFRNSTGQILAQASDAKVVYVTPALSYSLATTTNQARPGQAPPNGSLITLVITDRVNGALISRKRPMSVLALFVSAGAQKPLFCSFQSGYLSLLPEMIV